MLNGGAMSTNRKLIMLAKQPPKLEPKEVSQRPALSNSRPSNSIDIQFPIGESPMWPNNEDQGGSHPGFPMWAMIPEVSKLTIAFDAEDRDKSEPPEEMKLISELWATGIPDFDPMSGTDIPIDDPTPYRPSNRTAPSMALAMRTAATLEVILRPPRSSGKGHRRARLNYNLQSRIEDMLSVLRLFLSHEQWIEASRQVAVAKGRGPYYGRVLRYWIQRFILDPTSLPTNAWGSGNICRLDTDDGLHEELQTYLQGVGKYVKAEDLIEYLDQDDVKTRYGATTSISLATARRWMTKLGYRWTDTPSGQYVDGHEREDVVEYRQNVFLPAWFAKEHKLRVWADGNMGQPASISVDKRHSVYWVHDETVFYVHDRRERRWVPDSETAVPRPKGEGASLMISDFVSADYGWLRSPDGKESARVVIRPGAQRDGYFTNSDILAQVTIAMDIVQRHYPHDDHIFIFDNAPTHLKRADTALSARKMPLNTSKPDKNWLVETPSLDQFGKQLYGPNGKKLMKKVQMAPGTLADGSPQSFYFPNGHQSAGSFKGMKVILEERGFGDQIRDQNLKRECVSFRCPPGRMDCCIRRLLYSQPDFRGVTSLLEEHCRNRGFEVLFLPKFHPELNFIEQCWGRAKWSYRQLPASSREEDLQKNALDSLDSIPLTLMRRYDVDLLLPLTLLTRLSQLLEPFNSLHGRIPQGIER